MLVSSDYQSKIDLRSHERTKNKHRNTLPRTSSMLNYNNSAHMDEKQWKKKSREGKLSQHVPKLVQTQFAQFLNNLVEYSSELTYFAINAFQTSSLRRVQINTLQRFTGFCVPRVCAFYYNLDTEFDNFIQKMRLLCTLAKRTSHDIRVTRIHFPSGKMMNLPITRRSMEIFKCNINRLRDLKQIHQDIGYDLLLPNDQLYIALDLLLTDFELLNCELDAEIKFADAMILQTITKDIFLQYRIALSWIYPAVKYAAYRPGDFDVQPEIKKCDQPVGIQRINGFCGKKKKPMKTRETSSSTELQLLKHSTKNTNQNYISDDDDSLKYQKKRKKVVAISTTMKDFNRYLHEKKRHDVGMIKLQKSKSKKNIFPSTEYNRIIKNMSKISS